MNDDFIEASQEFDRQVQTLVDKDYPRLAAMSEAEFRAQIEPLKEKVKDIHADAGNIPFVIVIKSELIPAATAMLQVELRGSMGIVDMHPLDPTKFKSIDNLGIPPGKAYLLTDIDTGKKLLNVTPADAFRKIQKTKRTPCTIDEGVALVTQLPEVLKNRRDYCCFSLLASRRNDERVPALWLSKGKPRLGWCWDNNPHPWLGSASCGGRIGA